MKVLAHWLLSGIAVFVTARILPGVHIDGFASALVAAVVLGIVNALVRPILFILTLPINVLTLGLFTLVIVGGCVMLAARLVPGFQVAGMGSALMFAIVLSIVNAVLHSVEG